MQGIHPAGDELIVTLFAAAMSRPVTEREPFLREACAGNVALLEDVRRRVEMEARMDGFLLDPVVSRDRMDRPFAPGEIVAGNFEILREAGEGGMGIVYESRHLKLNKRVALKCPRFEFRRRLSPEALHSLQVTHPNVCRVYEMHTTQTDSGDVDFLTMEYLEGQTLAARLSKAPSRWLETKEGAELARQICAGLQAIHSQGVIHRDLKSSNVMLTVDYDGLPRAVIMDFGIAQTSDVFLSEARGTPDYLAPEIWKAQPATPQSDVYALGVLLYEMSCGRRPWKTDTGWNDRLNTRPAAPDANGRLRQLILRCLDPDPSKRCQSAGEVERGLRGGITKRHFLAAAAVAVAGYGGKEYFLPASPVRLAILPPEMEAGAPDRALLHAFLSDIEYRLKTLKHVRRPIAVFGTAETVLEDMKTVASAARFGATHALAMKVGRSLSGWSITMELWRAWDSRMVEHGQRETVGNDLASVLFGLQTEVVGTIAGRLALRPQPRAESLRQDIYADYLQGVYFARVDYQKATAAVPYFQKVIDAAPDSALGYAGMAEALLGMRSGGVDPALDGRIIAALDKAEKLDPDLAHVRLMAGRVAAAGHYYERALADAERAVELDPQYAEAHISMAYLLFMLKRPKEAEAALERAFAAQPGYYKSHQAAGLFHFEFRNYQLAEKHWREAIRLAPDLTAARLNLAILYLNSGRTAESEQLLRESLNIRKTRAALEMQGDLAAAAGRFQEAAASYEESLTIGPSSYAVWASLAEVYKRAGREADATQALRSGLRRGEDRLAANPRGEEPLAWCAYFHAAIGETMLARLRAKQAEDLASPRGNVRKRLILTYGLLNDIGAALRLLDGATPDLVKEIANSLELAPELRRDPNFQQKLR